MASIPAIGTGPVALTGSDGAHRTIPLGLLTFESGTVTLGAWPPASDATIKAKADAWIAYLAAQNQLTAGDVALAPSFSLEAATAGASGDAIVVKITKVTPADPHSDTTIDAEVVATDVYDGLTLANLQDTLGKVAGGGTKPGLVNVKSVAAAPAMPADAQTVDLTGNPAAADIMDGGAPAATSFSLEAVGTGGGADSFMAAIAVTGAATFTLTVTWSKKATVKLSNFGTTFGYVVACIPPQGGFATDPAVGEITLSGGSDPSTIAPAKAKASVASA